MDGRLTIEDGDILDLLELVTGNNRWEDGGARPQGASARASSHWQAAVPAQPARPSSRRNVAHHYDLGNELYDLFLDDDLQYSCAYFTDPANSLEQAQADKKAHIAAKLHLKPGQQVLDIGCGWGGIGALPAPRRRGRRHSASRLSRGAAEGRAPARGGSRRRRPGASSS